MTGMLLGIDLSNMNGHPDTYRDQPWYQQAQFVIVQAIRPPKGYPGYDVGGYTDAQLRAAKEDGKKIGIYVWLWHGMAEDDLRNDILHRLRLSPPDLNLDFRPWVDVEDTNPRVTIEQRRRDVAIAREVADEWAMMSGLPPSGGYSGSWFQNGYLGGWWPEGWVKWWADYSRPSGSIIADEVVAHQYGSTPVDMDVMLASELVDARTPPPAEVDQGWLDKKSLVVNLAGELQEVAQQLAAEATRKNGPRREMILQMAQGVRDRADAILQ